MMINKIPCLTLQRCVIGMSATGLNPHTISLIPKGVQVFTPPLSSSPPLKDSPFLNHRHSKKFVKLCVFLMQPDAFLSLRQSIRPGNQGGRKEVSFWLLFPRLSSFSCLSSNFKRFGEGFLSVRVLFQENNALRVYFWEEEDDMQVLRPLSCVHRIFHW